MECFVYILYSRSADKFYVGVTNDVEERLERHKAGKENFTRKYIPWQLLWYTKKPNKSSAFKLEIKLKNLSYKRKIAFLKKYSNDDEA